jgi:uncharacterized DUF497 family protein
MPSYTWSDAKNKLLQETRGISFEDVVEAIAAGYLLDNIKHPNSEQYPNQSVLVVAIKKYVYCVPYVMEESRIFLKTIFPSRKMKNNYLGGS